MRMSRCTSAVFVAFLLGACSSDDPCERSASKWESCNIDGGTPTECASKEAECVAECVNDSACDDLRNAATEGPYVKCLLACISE